MKKIFNAAVLLLCMGIMAVSCQKSENGDNPEPVIDKSLRVVRMVETKISSSSKSVSKTTEITYNLKGQVIKITSQSGGFQYYYDYGTEYVTRTHSSSTYTLKAHLNEKGLIDSFSNAPYSILPSYNDNDQLLSFTQSTTSFSYLWENGNIIECCSIYEGRKAKCQLSYYDKINPFFNMSFDPIYYTIYDLLPDWHDIGLMGVRNKNLLKEINYEYEGIENFEYEYDNTGRITKFSSQFVDDSNTYIYELYYEDDK